MSLTQGYTIDKDKVTYRNIDGEAVILNLDNGHYYSLNDVGTKIWEYINNQKSLCEILDLLKEEYKVPAKKLQKDLLGLLKDLQKERLVEAIAKK